MPALVSAGDAFRVSAALFGIVALVCLAALLVVATVREVRKR